MQLYIAIMFSFKKKALAKETVFFGTYLEGIYFYVFQRSHEVFGGTK